jgi:hypothetical protein
MNLDRIIETGLECIVVGLCEGPHEISVIKSCFIHKKKVTNYVKEHIPKAFSFDILHTVLLRLEPGIQQIQRHLITILCSSYGNKSLIAVFRRLVDFTRQLVSDMIKDIYI